MGEAARRGWVTPSRELLRAVIQAARTVHATLGPGFVELTYENALCVELRAQGLRFRHQVPVPIRYRDVVVGVHRVDLIVEGELVVELKAVRDLLNVHFAVLRSYLNAIGASRGLLFNFARDSLDVREILHRPLPPLPSMHERRGDGA